MFAWPYFCQRKCLISIWEQCGCFSLSCGSENAVKTTFWEHFSDSPRIAIVLANPLYKQTQWGKAQLETEISAAPFFTTWGSVCVFGSLFFLVISVLHAPCFLDLQDWWLNLSNPFIRSTDLCTNGVIAHTLRALTSDLLHPVLQDTLPSIFADHFMSELQIKAIYLMAIACRRTWPSGWHHKVSFGFTHINTFVRVKNYFEKKLCTLKALTDSDVASKCGLSLFTARLIS